MILQKMWWEDPGLGQKCQIQISSPIFFCYFLPIMADPFSTSVFNTLDAADIADISFVEKRFFFRFFDIDREFQLH